MAKEVQTESRDDQSTTVAISQKKFDKLLKICEASQNVISGERETISEKVKAAVDNDGLDKTAFAWIRRLAKMDEAKRNGVLFNFHVYCGYKGWPSEGLPLGDRDEGDEGDGDDYAGGDAEQNGHDVTGHAPEDLQEFGDGATTDGTVPPRPIPAEAIVRDDDGRDLRPRHLRTGSADPDPSTKH